MHFGARSFSLGLARLSMRNRLLPGALLVLWFAAPLVAATHDGDHRLDRALLRRAHDPQGCSRIIVHTTDPVGLAQLLASLPGATDGHLLSAGALGAEVPDAALDALASDRRVLSVVLDREVVATMERTAEAVGARWVRDNLGYDGEGIGIATIDSGVTSWHDDLSGAGGGQRVVHFADFVQHRTAPYDDYGHGTHVAGVLAGNGYDSDGARAGIAPGANIVALKVLDQFGHGYISDVIAAIDYAIANRRAFNIRIINVSVAAAVTESYITDPLTLATRRAVDAGIVVVAAAGNLGRRGDGTPARGGITAPGNAPWVITVGAASHMGTADRADDAVAAFSSRGPSRIDRVAKPDIVAPGVGIESLSMPGSTLYEQRPSMRLWGTVETLAPPYFSMTGTSMAAPTVSGTIALMLEANPALTPNAVKAILEYTAESSDKYDSMAQGAGFLNARGAVELARSFATGEPVQDTASWNRHVIWGNRRIGIDSLRPSARVWAASVTWGQGAFEGGVN